MGLTFRRIFLEWPAKLFDLWWKLYRVLLVVLVMAVVTLTVLTLLLEVVFGIRWGW